MLPAVRAVLALWRAARFVGSFRGGRACSVGCVVVAEGAKLEFAIAILVVLVMTLVLTIVALALGKIGDSTLAGSVLLCGAMLITIIVCGAFLSGQWSLSFH